MKILPYSRQSINNIDIKYVAKSLKNELITQGKFIAKLENNICKKLNVKYAIAVSSATAGLHISNLLFKKKKILTQALTFASTVSTIVLAGNTPILGDINKETLLLDIDKIKNENFDVIVNVLFAGASSNSIELREKFKNKIIIEDASHALGGQYLDGSNIGSCKYSDICIFSLHPVKSITSGEGGIITTNNKKYYEKLKILRNHGIIRNNNNKNPWIYKINDIGLNYRMNELQAALAYSQLKRLKKFITKRRRIAKIYDKILSINDKIYLPQSKKKIRASSAIHLYVICLNNKKINNFKSQLVKRLKKYGIGSQVHYIPIYKLNAFKKIKRINSLSNTERHYQKCLSIPCYFDLSFSKAKFIANKINQLLH